MRVLNTLYVTDHRARIGTSKGSLLVRGKEATTRVPLEQLEAVVLLANAEVTTPAMDACVKRSVAITALTRNGRVRFRVTGGTTGNVHLRVRQLDAHHDPGRTASIARSLVAGKLQNCRRLVSRWIWDSNGRSRTSLEYHRERIGDAIRSLAGASTGDRIRGIEGHGTYRYFRALGIALSDTPFPFSGRNRRPPRDAANALMGFLYALTLNEAVGALEAVGLDPQVGYLHGLRAGRPALALDLIEELRPAHADRFTTRMLRRRQLDPEHFRTTPGGAWHLTGAGRRIVLEHYSNYRDEAVHHRLLERSIPRWSLPQIQATLMARHLRGDLDQYPPYLAHS